MDNFLNELDSQIRRYNESIADFKKQSGVLSVRILEVQTFVRNLEELRESYITRDIASDSKNNDEVNI